MKHRVFIDGSVGTTGLWIFERLSQRTDIELLEISEQDRKNVDKRAEIINNAELVFLCLPDNAAIEICQKINKNIKILDTSTAHRTNKDWVYGMPEMLQGNQAEKIKTACRVAVPGCHATGFIMAVAPLVECGIAPADYPFTAHSITGFSGGGKPMIADYAQNGEDAEHTSPRQYALAQTHKHLPEMKKICGLDYKPVFNPIVSGFYSGMVVTIPIVVRLLKDKTATAQKVSDVLKKYYADQPMVKVYNAGISPENGFLPANTLQGSDAIEIFVFGNEEQIVVATRFDNLGKGSSGAAIQCMNIMLSIEQTKGLQAF